MKAFKNELCTLCSHHSDIISDKLAPQAADFKSFEINLLKQKWEVPSNRTPVRPQSSKKEHYLHTSIEEMLEDGVIERSNAAHHSHSVMVNKTADMYEPASTIAHSMNALSRPPFPYPISNTSLRGSVIKNRIFTE